MSEEEKVAEPTAAPAEEQAAFSPEDILVEPGEATTEAVKAPEPADAPTVEDEKAAAEAAQKEVQQKKPNPKITDADRDAFMRHILGGSRFVKEYSVGRGALKMKLQTRTVVENDTVYTMLVEDVAEGKLSTAGRGMDYLLRLYRYYMSASLISFTAEDRLTTVEGTTLRERYTWITNNLSEMQMRLMLRAQEEFEYLMTGLFEEAVNEDFTDGRDGAF